MAEPLLASPPTPPATPPSGIRRILLTAITLLVSVLMGQALWGSLHEPQVASRLELYQTNLLLQASAWQGQDLPPEQVRQVRQLLLGADPLAAAAESYGEVRQTIITFLEGETAGQGRRSRLRSGNTVAEQGELLDRVELALGVVQAQQGDTTAAIATWQGVQGRNSQGGDRQRVAAALTALWQGDSLPPDTESLLRSQLQGWFRAQALERFYDQTQQPEALALLANQAQAQGERTLLTLGLVGILPGLGGLVGLGILALVAGQRILRGPESWLARNGNVPWETPWPGEILWQVMVGGFLFLGQVVVPLGLSIVGGGLASFGLRGQATYALLYYLAMAAGTLTLLAISLRPYRPLPPGWFRISLRPSGWFWGLGGYFAALPLMLTVALVNQQLWQGQGGSNPLLQLVLEAQDPVALGIFFFTAAIAAPVFEELLFRGFLLPSLTRHLPVGGAIWVSSLAFAAAHLSFSEILPLLVLGLVLGLVYTRSRNLWAPILLHSAWNSATMLGLFLLGSGA